MGAGRYSQAGSPEQHQSVCSGVHGGLWDNTGDINKALVHRFWGWAIGNTATQHFTQHQLSVEIGGLAKGAISK